ncbi:hypothetical protein [Phyllobacterium phragmitis]|uniref:Antitoxin SocA-like Panacea domain-containing protein n=1 Tax=Phyllobacterium phragmitis TaxID=2670329 RepID=A0ABQ0GWG5_9HYPH
MIEREEYVAAIVDAAGGRLVSRIRLQKITYLLDELGMKSGFNYQYYHYGPYSRDLDNAILDAEAFEYIKEHYERRQGDGARYSVFISKKPPDSDVFGRLGASEAKQLIKKFAETNVTVLELAATIHWLVSEEKIEDWHHEVERRKGPKTENGRLDKAIALLREINLPPAAA